MKLYCNKIVFLTFLVHVTNAAVYDDAPDASVNMTAALEWSDRLTKVGEEEYQRAFGTDAPRMPSPEYWGDLSVYQIFPDRFNNGNPANDNANLPPYQIVQRQIKEYYDVYQYRHGGDFQGIIDRLDYIVKLGMKVIYLNPIFYNAGGEYHLYCVTNPVRIDQSMGTLQELQVLVFEAHKRGIRVILDFVVNHVCEPATRYVAEPDRGTCVEGLYQHSVQGTTGNVAGQADLDFGSEFFGPLKHQNFYSRCGGGLSEDFAGAQFGDFTGGLFDLNGNDPNMRHILTNMAKYWIASADIDGFRLDAVKHVTESFIAYFNVHVRDYALSVGKADFFIVGEILATDDWLQRYLGNMNLDPRNPESADTFVVHPGTRDTISQLKPIYEKEGQRQQYPGCTSVYDIGHSKTSRSAFRNTGGDLGGYLGSEGRAGLDSQGDVGLLWHYISNHDTDRFLQFRQDPSFKKNVGAMISAQVYMHTSQGPPNLYYMDEMGANGDCVFETIEVGFEADARVKGLCDNTIGGYYDSTYRQAMWLGSGFSLGSALDNINQLATVTYPRGSNRAHWQRDRYLQDNDIVWAIRKMAKLRSTCRALGRGSQYFRDAGDQGLLAFSRIEFDQEILVIINMTPDKLDVPNILVDGNLHANEVSYRFKNVLTQDSATDAWTVKHEDGIYLQFEGRLSLEGRFYVVFVRDDKVNPNWDYEAGVYPCTDGEAGPHFAIRFERSTETPFSAAAIGGIAAGAVATLFAAIGVVELRRRRRSDTQMPVHERQVSASEGNRFAMFSSNNSKVNTDDGERMVADNPLWTGP